ncbi:DUF2069 domain-containing protein [Wenzhouxiangella sediminis]|uniref:DUF2069 domain-containing protein n=1 Tax=Wenzhouxiangella sediminis TaxID=1792836 RepID=A0A3E1K866_9GAMM|nr:DUF2069 domain-containing protein [Wenzhouxiangella sediminis]RFF30258.1 DUF2069 domain-containing protein [Wenzhouxiangella sediminis]
MGPGACRWSLLGLIVLQPLWFGWLAPPELVPAWMAIAIMGLPLLGLLPFVWGLRKNALVVAGCLLLVHFCLAVSEAWANPAARVPAVIQVVLIGIYFTAMSSLRFGRTDER